MRCEFCDKSLSTSVPENLAFLDHVKVNADCKVQYGYLLDNLRTSWTRAMSGG